MIHKTLVYQGTGFKNIIIVLLQFTILTLYFHCRIVGYPQDTKGEDHGNLTNI